MSSNHQSISPDASAFGQDVNLKQTATPESPATEIRTWFLRRIFESKNTPAGTPKKGFNWRKFIHFLHRDLGFFFFGATIIYAASGLYLNHRYEWDLYYNSKAHQEFSVSAPGRAKEFTSDDATRLLTDIGVAHEYISHETSSKGTIKIEFENGSAVVDRDTGRVRVETLTRHTLPLLLTWVQLHFNPGRWWTWFSDLFCGSLLVIAFSGLFLLRGNKGVAGIRGAFLVFLGIAIPFALVYFHL